MTFAPPGLVFSGTVRFGTNVLFGPLDVAVPAGQWCCLLGPSGVGKSTVLQCLAGIAGQARAGTDAQAPLTHDGAARADDGRPLHGRIALMAQSDMLLPWLTVSQNIMLGARLRGQRIGQAGRARAAALIAQVGLEGLDHRKPSDLSGGQRQRVALARVLFEDRPVVLLDEPFSALDVATRARMQDLAAQSLAGRTVLQVTHDPAEAARLGHRIVVLTRGGMIEAAPPDAPTPRAPDAPQTLATTGRLTRMLLDLT